MAGRMAGNHRGLTLWHLGWALILLLVGALAVLLSLGLAINRRSLKLGRDGFSAAGGDDEHRD